MLQNYWKLKLYDIKSLIIFIFEKIKNNQYFNDNHL